MRVILTLLLTFAASLATGETPLLPNYVATYSATFNGIPIDVTRKLSSTAEGYAVTVTAKNWLGNMQEIEKFHIDNEDRILVDSYSSQRRFFGVSRRENLVIDRKRALALYDAKKKYRKIPLMDNYFGPLGYQLQMSRDLAKTQNKYCYQVLMRGKVKDYCFVPTGAQVLDTALGKINTVQMRRIREDQERETVFWLAPQWDYLLVKLWQKEEDGETYEIVLSGATVDGKQLHTYYPVGTNVADALNSEITAQP